MAVRFVIKSTQSKAERESDGTILRYTGTAEPYRQGSDRACRKTGEDVHKNPKLVFSTGLDETQAKFFKWYTDEEKKVIVKQIKEMRPLISDYFGGDDVIDSTNRYFWGENNDVKRLVITNEDIDVFYDTSNPIHALLYLSVISGAFMDLVAPTKDWAERFQIPHYLALETDDIFDDEDEITRSDAHGALAELRKDASPEALFILAWCIQYDTNAFGAYLKSTPMKELIAYHIKYIDGKISTKKKRNTPKVFMEYVDKWKGQQTRPALYTEAYVKAGEYYNFINQREKKYVTSDGTELGNTISEAVATLHKPKYSQDLEKLRDQVEGKWKE